MTELPYTKLHGDENDFLLTWRHEAPADGLPHLARKICARTTGVGADGWMLVSRIAGGLKTQLFNSDGSEPEISGNGTRCAAAFALLNGAAIAPNILIETAAGAKALALLSRSGQRFTFEMDMGPPKVEQVYSPLTLGGKQYDATILNVGNPQCAIFVTELPANWRGAAAEAESHPRFPKRSNISFVRVLDRSTIDVVFFERGAGETRSSGTGSTGAGAAAILRGLVDNSIKILTPAGALSLRWDSSVYLTGPAELIAEGKFYLDL